LSFTITALLACSGTWAAEPASSPRLTPGEVESANVMLNSPIVVTATRQEQNSFDLPVSIDVVDAEKIRDGQAQVNLSETAVRIPGVVVGNRNNYAQDLAVSTRGFGARSAFGVRGVRLYADGIPMSMPDGQGQTGTFNLDTAKRVEFLRGPFSALYGNSSGGVVQIFTADGPKQTTVNGGLQFGSYNTDRETLGVSGQVGDLNYIASAARLSTDGYRDHSEAMRNTFHTKLAYAPSDSSKLTLVATALNQPGTQDPLGLDITQLKKNPRQAGTDAEKFDTRVNKSHDQIGLAYDLDLNSSNSFHVMGYYGQRRNLQFQSISVALQTASDKHGGGVAAIDRDFGGVDSRWTYKDTLAGQPFSFTAGLNYDTMTDDRRGYENFIGTTLGVQGALRRDETDKVFNMDEYLQATWEPTKDWLLTAGVRHSRVHFDSKDHYFDGSPLKAVNYAGINADDSGSATFAETTPVGGVLFHITPSTNIYLNAGRGFETPTFVEMAYNPDITKAGLNFSMRPAKSHNYEAGIKSMLGDFARVNLAYFKINTDNEIVIATNRSGRAAYQNAGKSERHGIEASLDAELGRGFTFYGAYSWINAEYRDSFETCAATPCNIVAHTGTAIVASGNKIPGVYRSTAYAELAWKHAPSGFSTALEARANDNAYVDDLNSAITAGYALINWRGGFTQSVQNLKLSEFVRIDNLFDRDYVSSIRVGDLNGRYYEPGTSRSWLLGLNASYQF
jgi:iron complex outermembrane receptor protein